MSSLNLDYYSLQARLRPALFTLFPAFLTIAASSPVLYKQAVGLVGLAIACGLTLLLGHAARTRGRATEVKLISEWGGLPTTIWLRNRTTNLDPETKRRYHRFLKQNVGDWVAPTPDEETSDPAAADRRYGSAVKWLLEYTRDTKQFPLIFSENISYGFRRNTLGLKPIGLLIALASVAASGIQLHGMQFNDTASELPLIAAGVVAILVLAWWTFGVTSTWVRDAGDAYARSLLAACDTPKKI